MEVFESAGMMRVDDAFLDGSGTAEDDGALPFGALYQGREVEVWTGAYLCGDLAFCLFDGVVFGREGLSVQVGLGFDLGHIDFTFGAIQVCFPNGLHLYWNLVDLSVGQVTLFESVDLLLQFLDLGPKGCVFKFNSLVAFLFGGKNYPFLDYVGKGVLTIAFQLTYLENFIDFNGHLEYPSLLHDLQGIELDWNFKDLLQFYWYFVDVLGRLEKIDLHIGVSSFPQDLHFNGNFEEFLCRAMFLDGRIAVTTLAGYLSPRPALYSQFFLELVH